MSNNCPNCNVFNDDNAIYCTNCGTLLPPSNNYAPKTQNQYTPQFQPQFQPSGAVPIKKKSGLKKLFLVGVFALVGFFVFSAAKEIYQRATERELIPSDISLTGYQSGTTSFTVSVTAYINIKSCSVKIQLYNANDSVIHTETLKKNNLYAWNTYSYYFNFGYTKAIQGSYVRYIASGRVLK